MKRCPQCRRDFYDDSLLYCLDDGTALLEGPAHSIQSGGEPTAILRETDDPREAATKAHIEAAILTPSGKASQNRRAFPTKWVGGLSVAAMLLVATFLGVRYFRADAKQINSIAVMPFANESGNTDLDYLSDGMTDTLISSLSQIPNLNVKAHTSVFRYKGKDVPPATIAKELSAQAILNGRVAQRGDALTVNVELVDPQSENVIWSDKYERRQADLIALEHEIARDVSTRLRSRLAGEDEKKVARSYTADPEAYQLYLRGRYNFYRRLPGDMDKAIGYFDQAIQKDPNYALAYSGLADTYALTGVPRDSMPKAREAAVKALSLDSDLADAHNSLGLIAAIYDHDFEGAEREFKRAQALDPNNATTHFYLGNMYAHFERYDEALTELRKALELEPFSLLINRSYGDKLLAAGKFPEAFEQLNKTLDLDQNYSPILFSLAVGYQLTGDQPRSVEEFAKASERAGNASLAATVRDAYRKGGWRGFLRSVVDTKAAPILVPYYAALGENDKAFAELDRLFDERDYYMVLVREDRRLEPLHGDPRYAALLKRIRLEP